MCVCLLVEEEGEEGEGEVSDEGREYDGVIFVDWVEGRAAGGRSG